MRLLDRYLLRELLFPLGVCICAFMGFWIVLQLFSDLRELQEQRLRAVEILEYYLVQAPEFLVFPVIPVSLLLGLLYSLTNHARHHELIAMRAAGVSLWRMSVPYFIVGLIGCLVLFILNELCVPNTEEMATRILYSRVQKKANRENSTLQTKFGFTNSRERRIWQTELYNLRTFEMTAPQVDWVLPNGAYRELIAKRAIYTNRVWTFYDVWEHTSSREAGVTNRNFFPVLPMPDFSETPEQIKSEIKISSRLNLRPGRKADIPLIEIWDYLRMHPRLSRTDKSWLYTKLHGRLAAPWTCLVVVLIAIPFGAPSGRRNIFVGVASSILICFVYFILLQLGMGLGVVGWLPPWFAAWFPNLSFGLVGLWMTARVR